MHQTRTVVVVISFGAEAIISLYIEKYYFPAFSSFIIYSFIIYSFIIYREEQLYRYALIGTVPLTNFLYLLREYCSSPIFDLNLLRVAARIAAADP
jgi:hypothetical protein